MLKKGTSAGIFMLLLLLYTVLQWRYVALDFWNDELYTLRYFACASFTAILTDYHVPNNHILFNALNRLYLLLIGETDFPTLLQSPEKLRGLMFVYAGLTLWGTWKLGARFFSPLTGLLAVAITATTLPYLNFALQIRGYGLSALWLMGLLYSTLSFHKKRSREAAFGIIGSAGALMYTVPSNLYFILAIGLFWGIFWVRQMLHSGLHLRNKAFQIALLTAIGLKLALLAYVPVFGQVFNNPYVTYEPFKWSNLTYYAPVVLGDFISGRWWLLPFAVLGYALGRRHWLPQAQSALLLLTVLVLPFLLVYILGNTAPKRIFIPLVPVFALLLSIGIAAEVKELPRFRWQGVVALLLVAGYGVFQVFQSWSESSAQIMADIKLGGRSQGLTHQYYSWHYQPQLEVELYKGDYFNPGIPVGIVGCEPHGLRYFLEAAGIPYLQDANVDSLLNQHDTVDIFSSRPLRVARDFAYANGEIISYSGKLSYHTPIRLRIDPAIRDTLRQLLPDTTIRLIAQGLLPGSLPPDQPALSLKAQPAKLGDLSTFLRQQQPFVLLQPDSLGPESLPLAGMEYTFDFRDSLGSYHTYEAQPRLLERRQIWSSQKAQEADGENPYANLWAATLSDTMANHTPEWLRIDLEARFEAGQGGTLVFDVNRGGENIHWKGQPLDDYYHTGQLVHSATIYFQCPEGLQAGDRVQVYLWSNAGGRVKLERAGIWQGYGLDP
ncbi:hypothetical protein [Phaeodactylibacter xiamenensis]|uniref:hypothetical protein n=1 Tax=Phaeodactylibacter xiamenensis TaxID=1524460 RepID=UPI003CCBE5D8